MKTKLRIFDSLAWRLTAWYAVSSFAMVVLMSVLLYYALLNAFTRETDGYLLDTVNPIVAIIKKNNDSGPKLKLEINEELPARQYTRTYARVLDTGGTVLLETRGMGKILPPGSFPAQIELNGRIVGTDIVPRPGGRIYRGIAVTVPGVDGKIIQVGCDRKREEGILKRFRGYLYAVLSSSFLLCVVGGYLIARRGIQPVSRIADAASGIGHATLHARIDTANLPEEIRQLAHSFNSMLDRLEDSFVRISQFSEDIAHELRTPVNNLRGGMEVVLGKPRSTDDYRDAIGSALEECERLARLVDRLLFIARSENSTVKIERESVNILDELTHTAEFFEANAEESGVRVAVEADKTLKIPANRDLLRSLLGNLVSNALAHTAGGGRVRLTAEKLEQTAAITIADTGKGISDEHLPQIFNRFYRVDPSRTKTSGGVGLGLAIVSTIAKLHHAELSVQSELGKGTAITVKFPLE